MPNSRTFDIAPIRSLIDRYAHRAHVIVDPFANNEKIATITNDLDPQYPTDYHEDAEVFLKRMQTESVDLVLYDPPYSLRQVSECYKKFGMTVNMQTTQSSYWRKQKEQIARIVSRGGMLSLSVGIVVVLVRKTALKLLRSC